jgi:hypothetical protein
MMFSAGFHQIQNADLRRKTMNSVEIYENFLRNPSQFVISTLVAFLPA